MTTSQRWTMVAAILGSGTVFLDGTVVNVALKRIGQELPASVVGVLEGQTYVTSGYLATLAALLILAGALSDHLGRRRMFTIGLAGFGLTSVLCGLAPSLELLVAARVLQGAAGALLVPGSLAIIAATFEGPARARAFGLWAAATSATIVLGPIVGGVLVGTISWRMAFLINLPLLAVALYATRRYMEESWDERAPEHFDWLGALVGAIAVGGLAFGAIRGQQRDWTDPIAFLALGVGSIALVTFPVLMARRADPLVPLELFRVRRFAILNLSTFLIYGALYVTLAFQAVFFQGTLGYSPLAAGMLSLPSGLLLMLLSTRVGALAGRIGFRRFLVAGPALMAAGTLWLARIPATSRAWEAELARPDSLLPPGDVLVDVLPGLVLAGLGMSLVVAPLTSALMSSVPVRQAGLASAINNAVSRVGQPLLGALIFVAITAGFYGTLGTLVPGLDTSTADFRALVAPLNPPAAVVPPGVVAAAKIASTDAFHLAMGVAAALLAGGTLVNALGPDGEPASAVERAAAGD
ncbi:MAG: MFS transporter [Chloroflexota bacterium]